MVEVQARDGYRIVFALAEFDDAFSASPAILVDRRDGAPLPDEEGPLRIVVPGERRAARWVRQVEHIVVRDLPPGDGCGSASLHRNLTIVAAGVV